MDQKITGDAGMPDAWQRLWAPHRLSYLEGENRPAPADEANSDGCPFCRIPKLSDEEGLIVARGKDVYLVMSLYPYNAVHVVTCTYRHFADLTGLPSSEKSEMFDFTSHAMKVLRKVSRANGFNIGINQGAVSGAGVAGHIHQHLIPRWAGDANFMPLIGKTKVLPQLLNETREQLAHAWNQV